MFGVNLNMNSQDGNTQLNFKTIQLNGQAETFTKLTSQINNEVFKTSFPIQNSVQKILMMSQVIHDIHVQEEQGQIKIDVFMDFENSVRKLHFEFSFQKTLDQKYDVFCNCDCEPFQKNLKCEHSVFSSILVLCAAGYFDTKKLMGRNYYISESNMKWITHIKENLTQFDQYENPSYILITPYCAKYLNGAEIQTSDFLALQSEVISSKESEFSTTSILLSPLKDNYKSAPMVKPVFWGENIQFVWKDYRVLNLREILQGKKGMSIELLSEIQALTKNYVSQDYDIILKITEFFIQQISYFPESHINDIKKSSRILFGLKEFAEKHKIQLAFSPQCDFSKTRAIFPLKNIKFQSLKTEVPSYKLFQSKEKNEDTQTNDFIFQCNSPALKESLFYFYDGCWDPDIQEFTYYDIGPSYSRIYDEMKSALPTVRSVQTLTPEVTREVCFKSMFEGLKTFEHLQEMNINVDSSLPEIQKLHCDVKNIKINLHKNIEGQLTGYDFLIDLQHGEDKKSVTFHLDYMLFPKIFMEGLSAFSYQDHKELASKNSLFRSHDLKFLRHLGSAITYLTENISYILTDRSSDGKSFQSQADFFKFLEFRMLKCVYPKDDYDEFHISPNLRKKFFKTGILDVLTDFLNEPVNQIVGFDGSGPLIQIELDPEIFLDFGLMDVLYLMESQGPSLLMKEKSDIWQNTFIHHFYNGGINKQLTNPCFVDLTKPSHRGQQFTFSQISGFDPWTWVTRITESGYHVTLNHSEIETLGGSDFDTSFQLKSTHNSLMGERAPNQWFELNPEIFFKGQKVEWGEVDIKPGKRFIEYRGQLYMIDKKTLPRVEALMQFWEKIESSSLKGKKGEKKSQLTLPKHAILELLHLHQQGIKIKGGKEWDQILSFYESLANPEKKIPLVVPKQLDPILKSYQRVGYQWLYELYHLRLGALLADDMGLGKTIQTLTFLEKLRLENKLGLCLIVVPTSLVYNWMSEAEKFTPDLPIQVLTAQTKNTLLTEETASRSSANDFSRPMILVTTYGLMVEHDEKIFSHFYNILIFDEAQNLKNLNSQRTIVARKINANYKIAITGTPLENHFGEFYSLLDLVIPGALGDYSQFIKKSGIKADAKIDFEFLGHVRQIMKPVLLRRTKKDVGLNLPPKVESVRKLDMEDKQRTLYRNIAVALNEKVKELIENKGENFAQLEMLTALLRLRQVCSDPAAVPGVIYKNLSPKIQSLVEEVEEVVTEGESVLVFTQFLSTLHRIEGELKERKVEYRIIVGETPRLTRESILRDFQSSDKPMALIMTLKTGGVGLNLTKASRVFHVEPWWNPAVENQATDRAYRLGQERDVNVVRFIMRDTVEERIQVLKDLKGQKFSALFESEDFNEAAIRNSSGQSFLSKSDFQQLLSLDFNKQL